ncbi:MAG TPA: efflux transporter outer membrane subunit [Alcaligenaceae bacterium]|nr:efflux transporter outer membrane subunit [Alcaligenaceae bacterium]
MVGMKSSLTALAAALVLAGCSFAPKYERPTAPVAEQFDHLSAADIEQDSAKLEALGWREFFTDAHLQGLIELALLNNRDIRIAIDRIEEARAQYGIAQSDQFPVLGVGGTGQVTRNPSDLRAGGPDAPSVSRFFQAGVGLTSFELDFFGRIRNLSDAAYNQYLATEQAQQTVRINVVAQVAEAYFRWRSAQQMQDLMASTLASRERSYKLVNTLFEVGTASALEQQQAQLQLDTIRADMQQMNRAQMQAYNALTLLVGTTIPDDLPKPAVFGKNQIVADIPVGLPSSLLERRPDILAAEFQLKAAYANVGAARAAFFPNVSITGLLGVASPAFSALFDSGRTYWQYAPQITMPLFSGGVKGALDLAKARQNVAISNYEKSIQVAFKEVADALAGEATYAQQLEALRAMESSAAKSLRLANLRYETGIDSFLQVQTAEINLYGAQQLFVQTGMESLLNRVLLYKALGGGWQLDVQTQEQE